MQVRIEDRAAPVRSGLCLNVRRDDASRQQCDFTNRLRSMVCHQVFSRYCLVLDVENWNFAALA
jgi:hypothetical protein